jgi:hypothetical protein
MPHALSITQVRKARHFVLSCIAAIAFFNSSSVATQPVAPSAVWSKYDSSVGAIPVALPVPPGFVEPSAQIPQFRSYGEQFTPQMNRLLAIYISEQDFQRVTAKNDPEMKRYFLAQTLRANEGSTLSKADFDKIKVMLKDPNSGVQKIADAMGQEALDNAAKKIGDGQVKLKLGESKSLGMFDQRPDSLSTMMLTKGQAVVNGKATEVSILTGTNILRLKDRLVYFYAYSRYEGKSDIEWVSKVSKDWVTQATALNQ